MDRILLAHPPAAALDSRLRAWWFAGLAFCVFMLCVHVAAGLNSPGLADSWRDLWWATQIAHGERLPLSGPPIYGMLELGPWWFYLLAIPMALTHSAALTCAWVQVLAALKYVLAWRLGIRLADARLGFVFAASLAIPGWSTVTWMFPSHTALVETMLLTLTLVGMRCWHRFTAREAVVFGLVAAACVHAHPTTLGYVAVCGVITLWRHRSHAALGWMLVAAAIVVASVAPPWFDRSAVAPEALKPVASYLQHDVGVHPLTRLPALLRGLSLGGSWWGLVMATSWKPAWLTFAWTLQGVCLAFGLAGLLQLRRHAPHLLPLAAGMAALLGAQSLFLVLLRPVTPMWMVPSCLPPLALLIGSGWYGWLLSRAHWLRTTAAIAMSAYFALALVPFALELRGVRSVRVLEPSNPLSDAGAMGATYHKIVVPFYPVRWLDDLAGNLCAPAVLHGRLASVIETTWASPLRNACGDWPELRYGGVAGPGSHLAGVLDWMARTMALPPTRTVAHMALYDNVRPIAPPRGGVLAPMLRRQINPLSGSLPLVPLAYTFASAERDQILLTNRLPEAAPMSIRSITANDHPAQLMGSDGSSFAYRCAGCAAGSRVTWVVQIEGIEANLDLVVLRSAPAHD